MRVSRPVSSGVFTSHQRWQRWKNAEDFDPDWRDRCVVFFSVLIENAIKQSHLESFQQVYCVNVNVTSKWKTGVHQKALLKPITIMTNNAINLPYLKCNNGQ